MKYVSFLRGLFYFAAPCRLQIAKVAAHTGTIIDYSLGQLTSHPLTWPSFGKGQLIDIVSLLHQLTDNIVKEGLFILPKVLPSATKAHKKHVRLKFNLAE